MRPTNLLGVVLAAAAFAAPAAAHNFNYNDVYLGYLKLAPPANVDQATDQYMMGTQAQTWQRAKENELTFPQQAAKARENLKWLVGTFNIAEPFELDTDSKLGVYDPKTQTFDFGGLSSSTYFTVTSYSVPDLKVTFVNTYPLAKIKVPLDVASRFIGKVGEFRYVDLHIRFVLTQAFRGTNAVKAKIVSVTVTSHDAQPKMTLTTVELH